MKQGYTHISVVLDRSGSMQSTKDDAEGGFNSFLVAQKAVPGEATISLAQFDDVYETVYEMRPLLDAPRLVLSPRNNTALLDAIGQTINVLGSKLSEMPEAQRPEKVIVVIITDGQENASRHFTSAQINDLITHQRDVYKWEFVFIGSNQDAISTASALGISARSSLTYANNAAGNAAAYTSLAKATTALRSGDAVCMLFSDEDRQEQKKAGA